jgi:hypothetical protein
MHKLVTAHRRMFARHAIVFLGATYAHFALWLLFLWRIGAFN